MCVGRFNPLIMKSLVENNNMITTAEVLSLGFSKQLLLKYVRACWNGYGMESIFCLIRFMMICIR